MPVIHTRSADPLDRITLERGRDNTVHVWLRNNIIETVGDDAGNAIPVWEADEVYFHSDSPVLLEDVEACFDALWAQALQPPPPPLEDQVVALYEAVGELGVLLTEGVL